MNWELEYRSRCMDAAEALKLVHSGERVWIHSSCSTPRVLIDALVARGKELHDVEIVHMKTLGPTAYTNPEFEGHFRHRGLFVGENVRAAVQAGRADYTPILLCEIEALFTSGNLPLDVVLMQVSRPDAHGYVSMGAAVDCTLSAARSARVVIAEVNDQMPRTHGETNLHVSHFTALVGDLLHCPMRCIPCPTRRFIAGLPRMLPV